MYIDILNQVNLKHLHLASCFTSFIIPELADMADAAPAGDRGGFRGGFGDRGRQVFQIF